MKIIQNNINGKNIIDFEIDKKNIAPPIKIYEKDDSAVIAEVYKATTEILTEIRSNAKRDIFNSRVITVISIIFGLLSFLRLHSIQIL